MIKKLYYISEIFLPSTSAYSIHVMKICNEFSNFLTKHHYWFLEKQEIKIFINYINVKIILILLIFILVKITFLQEFLYALKIIIFLKKKIQ